MRTQAFNKITSRRYRDLKITTILPENSICSNLSSFKINCKNMFPEIHVLLTGMQQNSVCVYAQACI